VDRTCLPAGRYSTQENMELMDKLIGMLQMKPRLHSAVGIDIGSYSLKVVGMKILPGPAITFSSITPLSGLDGKNISAAIRTILDRNGCRDRKVILTFSDRSVVIKRIELPSMGPSELPEAVKWQMKDSFKYEADEALFDFSPLGTSDKEDGSKMLTLLVAAAPRELVESKIAILKDAGLEVVSISFAPFGLENIIKASPAEDTGGCLLVADFGHSGTEISVFEKGRLEFVREVPVSSLEISEALTGTLAGEKGTVSLTKDEAEKVKIEKGFPYDPEKPDDKISSTQIVSLIRPILETFANEIKRSIGYYSNQYNGGKVSVVYLAGSGAYLKNLDRFLQKELGLRIKTIGIPASVTANTAVSKEKDAALAALAGAVIGYGSRPNLLPYEYKLEKIEFVGTMSLRIAAFVFALLLLTSFLFTKTQLSGYKQRLASIDFQRDFLRQVNELKERVDEREDILKKLESTEIRGAPIIRELSRLMPPSIILDWIKISTIDRTMDIGGVVLGARGDVERIATKFMGDIEKSKYFKEAQLSSIQEDETKGEEMSKFEINFMFE